MTLFTGLSAFPLTPIATDRVDEGALATLIGRIATARVDSITALGSTGSYAYLSRAERARVTELTVEHADGTPVFVGVGALRTSEVLTNVAAAEQAGAQGVLLAPVSYQPLIEREVALLFRTVTASTDLPVVVYDNPGTTRFTFTLDLYAEIAVMPGIASIKIPPVSGDVPEVRMRIERIRSVIPEHVTIGISGDASAATAMLAGCDAWYSVLGGTLPEAAREITRLALGGHQAEALAASARYEPIWNLFAQHGSLRVVAAIAEHLGLAHRPSLPLPLQGLDDEARSAVTEALTHARIS